MFHIADDVQALVVDNGSGMIKAGFAGDDAPRAVFPTLVGRPKIRPIECTAAFNYIRDSYVGDQAISKRGILSLKCPIQRGIVINWEDMEKIWHHTFYNELGIAPEEHPVVLTESNPLNPKANREKMIQSMFDCFSVPATCVAVQALLGLVASGRSNGMVLDSGHGITHAVPIYEGHVLNNCTLSLDLAGHDVNGCLKTLLCKHHADFNLFSMSETVRHIKETCCYIALDYEMEMSSRKDSKQVLEQLYELPDGNMITLGCERFQCTEILFQPHLAGGGGLEDAAGIPELVFNSIRRCDLDLRNQLYSNVILSGGSTMFEGIPERMKRDLEQLVPSSSSSRICVVCPPGGGERNYSVWIGGSILASMGGGSFSSTMWISKREYDEVGTNVISRRKMF